MGGGPDSPLRQKTEPPKREKKEFRVLVTGMGPFPDGRGGHYGENDNTSHLITKLLPSLISPSSTFNPTSLPIHIINPTAPSGKFVKTEYAYIRTYIQKLYDEYKDSLDAIIHLGMADGWEWFSLEERAFHEDFKCNWWGPIEESEGYYRIPDDAGKTVQDISDSGGKGMWRGMPMGLASRVDVPKVATEAMMVVNRGEDKLKVAVVSHFDPGSYGCGFIYYESLATCMRRLCGTKVLFCHVPGWREEVRLDRGRDVICAVIGSVCKQIS